MTKHISQSEKSAKAQFEALQEQLYETQKQLQKANDVIFWVQTSKFWKLRSLWLSARGFFKKSSKIDLLLNYINYIQKLETATLSSQLDKSNLINQGIPISLDLNYQRWLIKNFRKKADLSSLGKRIEKLEYKPVIGIIMPVYNTPCEYLEQAIESVIDQVYPYWELCIADDASTETHVIETLHYYSQKDNRIKVALREQNGNISEASSTALSLASGDFIALLDHDDLLSKDALFEVALLLNQHPNADMIYSDEDKVGDDGYHSEPYFKPDWCPDSFLSRMYTSHLGVYRRSVIEKIGGFRRGFEGSQDYDLVLRFTEQTKPQNIYHIPKVLYHWRIHPSSTAQSLDAKNYATEAGKKALQETLERRGEPGQVTDSPGGHYIVRYAIKSRDKISIIIPTRNLGSILDTCLTSIFHKSTYENYEVLVIDNGSDESETLKVFEKWLSKEPNRFRCVQYDIPFNYSKINNYAVNFVESPYLLFLNNDTEVITEDWLEAMLEQCQRPSVGVVGVMLLYPDRTIQHAGVIQVGQVAGHSHKYFHESEHGYFNQIQTVNNYSALTAACLMCKRSIFNDINGFNEDFKVAFNDVDFCLRVKNLDLNNIYLPHVRLFHHESKTRGAENSNSKIKRFKSEISLFNTLWPDFINRDPCYSLNLSRDSENYDINLCLS